MNIGDTKTMLELRAKIKGKKPNFLRQDFQIKKLKKTWRKAKGIHSKMRRKMAGHILMPNPGFGSPRIVKGMNSDGLREIIVYNAKDLENVKDGYCAVISRNVGMRKRIMIASKAKGLGMKIANISEIDGFLSNAENEMKKRREKKKGRSEKKPAARDVEKKEAEEKKQTKENEKEMKKKVLEKKA
ncbi:50S ribosomal protein L32e [Candidatus Woesearchaeota archaeon]|nr:50S ribosomal protein L32e [Candidatus Woesearchaeota archaeon]